MNFNKLPKEKRLQLVLVVVVTAVILAGLGFSLVKSQYQSLQRLEKLKRGAQDKLQRIQNTVKQADQLEQELARARQALRAAETDTASGDLYASVITTLRHFKANYQVEIPQFSPLSPEGDVTLLANFPYKQAVLTVSGIAHFQEFGRFLADFENQFPHVRIVNLTIDPNPSPNPEQRETISFKIDIVTLVRPNAS
jgi:Tfp pilus assembly protein PilO